MTEVSSTLPSSSALLWRGSQDGQEEDASFVTLIRKAQKQWSHRGIIEINEQHRLYKISRCIQMGIRKCIDPHPKYQGENDEHQEGDYLEVITETYYESDIKKQFEFHSYAPKVFNSLRALVGVTEAEYLESLAPSGPPVPCLEFITSSKSGMMFFLSNNKAFIMKTEKPQDITFLRSHFLRRLVGHFQDFPHSLLVKIVGCYYIRMSGSKGLYFTVMQSVFYPDERITERYDLKGCSASRYVQPLEERSKEVIVLKDNNFEGKKINIGPQTSWFKRQVDIDTKFLEEQGIMDYSLLLGIQKLHADEKTTANKLADVVSRARRSIKSVSESPNSRCPRCGRRLSTWNRRSNIINQQLTSTPERTSHPKELEELCDTEHIVQEILAIEMNGDSHQCKSGPHRTAGEEVHLRSGPGVSVVSENEQRHSKKTAGSTPAEGGRNSLPGMIEVFDELQEDNVNQPNHNTQQEPGTGVPDPVVTPKKAESLNVTSSAEATPHVRYAKGAFCHCTGRFQTDKCDERNQRLLPNTLNPLHIIDGEDNRYFIGIIDVLTLYSIKKKVEHFYKCLRYPTETFSTVKPEHYARRFRESCYAKSDVTSVPEKGPLDKAV